MTLELEPFKFPRHDDLLISSSHELNQLLELQACSIHMVGMLLELRHLLLQAFQVTQMLKEHYDEQTQLKCLLMLTFKVSQHRQVHHALHLLWSLAWLCLMGNSQTVTEIDFKDLGFGRVLFYSRRLVRVFSYNFLKSFLCMFSHLSFGQSQIKLGSLKLRWILPSRVGATLRTV